MFYRVACSYNIVLQYFALSFGYQMTVFYQIKENTLWILWTRGIITIMQHHPEMTLAEQTSAQTKNHWTLDTFSLTKIAPNSSQLVVTNYFPTPWGCWTLMTTLITSSGHLIGANISANSRSLTTAVTLRDCQRSSSLCLSSIHEENVCTTVNLVYMQWTVLTDVLREQKGNQNQLRVKQLPDISLLLLNS